MSTAETEEKTGTEFIVEAGHFGTFLDALDALVDECKLRFTDEGLAVTAVDPGNVAFVDTTLPAEGMESYEFEAGVVGINISRFQDIADLGKSGDLLHITFDRNTRKMIVSGDGFEYDYATIDPESVRSEPDLPDLELESHVVIESDDLNRATKGVDMVGKTAIFSTDSESGELAVEGAGDTDDLRFEFDDDALVSVDSFGDVESILGLDYLKEMVDPMVGTVNLRVGDEMPVTFEFEAPHGPVFYAQAPRIVRD